MQIHKIFIYWKRCVVETKQGKYIHVRLFDISELRQYQHSRKQILRNK